MSSQDGVDVCIVNYFGADDVARCVRTLGGWPHGRVWVVENSADTAERDKLAALPGIELLTPDANLGFGRGCNLAFERSTEPYFLLLNPDALIGTADLQVLLDTLRSRRGVGAVSPRIWWNAARTFMLPSAFAQTPAMCVAQSLAPRFRGPTLAASRRYLARQGAMMSGTAFADVPFLAGAVMLLRREAVVEAGGLFDPGYFMFYEDSDLSVRLRRSGWRLGIAPAASAVHEYRHKAFKAGLMAQSRETYFRKLFPAFHRSVLPVVDRWVRPVPVREWFDVLEAPCETLHDFEAQAPGTAIVAFSPSMTTMPAIFRLPPDKAAPFTQAEWDLLEPAQYTALVQDGKGRRWLHFRREAPQQPGP
jgi:GT2 family glycosyltransferase